MQKLKLVFTGLIVFLCAINLDIFAQVSSGGSPLKVAVQKSARKQVVEMPPVSPDEIKARIEMNQSADGQLKPLVFAHAFEVEYSPANSGQWFSTDAGYNVWQLTIHSAGAFSLNLIFSDFELPEGARLFLYNEVEQHFLGAYTSLNNKSTGMFAVSPVSGEEITVQYEVPKELGTPSSFVISRVNHDFVGILKSSRRPMGVMAGSCNVDVNCEIADPYSRVKDAVCRLIVNGREICSGTLVNNTAQDGKPYVLSAAHCYDTWNLAAVTVYTFNYESPYCAPLDGDPGHSITGAIMKAQHDSLDFALVEMSLVPPPVYRPYYAGWNHTGLLPDSTVSIHHPQGDVKKIAFDHDKPTLTNFTGSGGYTPMSFLKIGKWEDGVTEIGSSGGGLFNTKGQLIGTLTGGLAVCGNPVNDYFASFSAYWDKRSDSTKQVAYWLDPLGNGLASLGGLEYYKDNNRCGAFTNLTDDDEHAVVEVTKDGKFAGYWGGSNSVGISEIVERFSVPGNESLKGVSLGVGKNVKKTIGASNITVKVYDGNETPGALLYSESVNVGTLAKDAMNYIQFNQDVNPVGAFFVGIDVSGVQAQDTFVLYQSMRNNGDENNFYFKQSGNWHSFKDNNNGAMVNVMELIACNFDEAETDTPSVVIPADVWIYPNPTKSLITVASKQDIMVESMQVFNLLGQEINVPLVSVEEKSVQLDFSGKTPGIYIVRFNYNGSFVQRKFSVVSN